MDQLRRPEPVARTLSACSFGFFTAEEARAVAQLARFGGRRSSGARGASRGSNPNRAAPAAARRRAS